jgi:2-succinyl-6-hydroxy-2,4-cyclohexadiene-1-carboxylate synthase
MIRIKIDSMDYACYIHQQESSLPHLLMLHGFMGDHRVFSHLIDPLRDFCNPITIDLLGFGNSSKPTNPEQYHEEIQINHLIGIVDQLDTGPLFLSGYSMGGRLALKTALSAPECFAGLLLESTTCGIVDEHARSKRRKTDAANAKQIEQNFEQFLSSWQQLELFKSPRTPQKNLIHKYRSIQKSQVPEAISASLLGFGTGMMSPACEEIKQLNIPVLLMAGTVDQKYQGINKFLYQKLPNATFSSIKAGHRIHLDNPKALITKLKKFIQTNQ